MIVNFHAHHLVSPDILKPKTFGIHPWIADVNIVPPFDDRVWSYMQMVGECGIDKLHGPAIETQVACFERQIEIAEQYGKPVVVHCVHADDILLALRKKHMRTPWVYHGFIGGPEQALQLKSKGIEISIGAALLDKRRLRLQETVKQLGVGNFLLETDDSDADIFSIYARAAAILNVDEPTLERAIETLYHTIINNGRHPL